MDWLWDVDQRLQHAINSDWRSEFADIFFRLVTWIGLDHVVLPFILILVFIRSTRGCGYQCLAAYAVAGPVTMVIKRFISRFRPGFPEDGVFVAPDEQIFLNSFPSGHTSIAFAVAFTLALAWPGPRRRWVGGSAVGVACLVGISRIYRGVHWPTDIIASIAIAFLAALAAVGIVSLFRARASRRPSEGPA
ncbi:MAG: phosphatase PAP2 family protein [Armatimonadota bacterium]|nr:phosphatase PAP2 family protein [Armatimonadota bacterium]